MATIKRSVEAARGCGYRKPGGLYLVSNGLGADCGKLPIPLTVCPCCGAGIKPSRGFTWVNAELISNAPCSLSEDACTLRRCKLNRLKKFERLGLIWVGESFYKTTHQFTTEAINQGFSRRINSVPREFKIGKTWVLLAHRKAIFEPANAYADESGFVPGVFSAFKPTRIEYVVTGEETEEQLDAMEARGLTLIDVVRDIEEQTLNL